jgi:hypothetical protein
MSRTDFSCNTGWTIYDGVSDVIPDPLWRYARRVPRITYAYRGLPALASLSMAGSECYPSHDGI